MNQAGKVMLVVMFGVSLLVLAPEVSADIKPGVRTGVYFDAESAFIGGEVLADITDSWFFNPNLEYVFLDAGSLWTFNFDVHYDLPTGSRWYFWLGAGPAIIYLDPDNPFRESDTDFGVNLFAGVGYPLPG